MRGRFWNARLSDERGIALVAVMLLLMLISAILAGFLVTATGDMRLRAVDRARTQAFYAAHAGLEKLTADLGDLFQGDFSPESDDIEEIEDAPPELDNVTFVASDGLGYDIGFTANGAGDPSSVSGTIDSGPFQGFVGLITPYTLTVTSHSDSGAEMRLQRTMQTVSIPVFQFGVFSETDLTFSANGTFSFGGRVHSNGNLFLAAAAGGTLYLRDKVTAVGDVVRGYLANSRTIGTTHNGTVMVNKGTATCPGTSSPYTACRPLAANEGSVTGNAGSSQNSNWMNLFGTYNGYLRNNRNGITRLELPLVSDEAGGEPIDLIRLPIAGEEDLLTSQRLYAQAAIRILLADEMDDITTLPGVSAGNPLSLNGNYKGVAPTAAPFLPPFATTTAAAGGVCTNGYCTPANVPLIGGYLKIEYRNDDDEWTDVTTEWLDLGYTRRNIDRATMLNTNSTCNEPNGNAILRLQRIKQNPQGYVSNATICNTIPNGGSTAGNVASPLVPVGTDMWPLTLYDTREAYNRDGSASLLLHMAGVIHYIDLDVNNLRLWLADTIPGSGDLVANDGGDGYAVYFSDRRGNRNAAGNSTGEFGWEDNVNGATSGGAPNSNLNDGEDVNSNGTVELYGRTPRTRSSANVINTDFTGYVTPYTNAALPYTNFGNTNAGAAPTINTANRNNPQYRARSNPPLFFRRALKLTNGGLGNLPADGLTIASENPVYVEGHYNAGPTAWGTTGAPAAIMADSITLLSENWKGVTQMDPEHDDGTSTNFWFGHGDTRSFYTPNDPNRREAANTWYRFAALAGKTRNWEQTWESGSFGTDGGVHNFLRLIEDWAESSRTLNYKGSIASFFFSRQATGLFRCCDDVYNLPANRNLSFDTNFLNPTLLPPKTPMFRDINTTGFVQVTRRQ
jgi:hypothetical protein